MLYAISKQIATVYIEICIFGWYGTLNIPIEKKISLILQERE